MEVILRPSRQIEIQFGLCEQGCFTRGHVLSADDCLAIRTIHSAWLDAELRGDSSALLKLCTPMPVWLPPNEPPLCGKAAILLWLEDQSETTVRRSRLPIFRSSELARWPVS